MPKFLIIRFSSIGDIVLTTPVIRCLKQQVPNAEVHFLTKKEYSFIIDNNPYIDKKFFLEKNFAALMRLLKREDYDYIIDLHYNTRSFIVKTLMGVKSHSFEKLNIEKWMVVNFKFNPLPQVHIVDRYMDTVKSYGVKNDDKGLDYFLSPDDENALQQIPESHRSGYVGFVIGGKYATKRLPVGKIISICEKINQPIVLLGGIEDKDRGERIVKAAGSNVYNACGKFPLNETAVLIKHALKIISHDTGLMHIAAAFKKEITSVWGNTIPEFGMSPYLSDPNSKIVQVKNLPCRPCSKLGFAKCPKGHFKCMKEIDESVFI